MRFILRMAAREIRASWRRLVFFFVCIAVGVASIVAIRSVIQSVREALALESRAMTGGDVVVRGSRPFTEAVGAAVARERRAGHIAAASQAVEVATMVRSVDAANPLTKMVELRAVQPEYPLYGQMTLQRGVYSHDLLRDRGVLVRPELLAQLGLAVGDGLLIGSTRFEIRGVVQSEPDRDLGVFSLGPRIFIDYDDLQGTGLISFGSRVEYEWLLAVPGSLPGVGRQDASTVLAAVLSAEFANELVNTRSYRERQNRMTENLTRAENYLSLVGLVVLILGGIGVSSVTQAFIQQKMRSIAILKCIGGTSRHVLAIYVLQVLLLGVAGSVLGVGLAVLVVGVLPAVVGQLAELLPVSYGVTVGAAVQGLAVGLLVSLLFSLVPLLGVRHVKPSLLLRQDVPPSPGVDWVKWGVTAVVAASLVGVAAWQAGSLNVGLFLSGGFVAVAAILHGASVLLIRAIRPLARARSFALRHAVLRVVRPGNQTRVVLLAVGLGAFFILGVRALQSNLIRDFALQVGVDAPDMFLMDVQPAQRDAVAALVDATNGDAPGPNLIPVLRARVVGVRGRDVTLDSYEDVRGRNGLSREFTVTYREALQSNETLLQGAWWDAVPGTGDPQVSIEESLSRRFQIQIGDEMRFDVLGRIVAARVTSIREVDFRDFRAGGFMLVFRPGVFDGAPHTYVASLKGPASPEARSRMQSALVTAFPNVSVIDLREVLDTIAGIVANVTLAVTVVGGLVLLSGSLILVGAVFMTKFRRVYEAAILKTLGASGRVIATMLLIEYGVLGTIAGTVGALGAVALSWGVATYALELPWSPDPLMTAGGILATAMFVAVIGVLSSVDVLRHKPLATLRAE